MTTSDNAHKEKLVTYMKNLKVSNSSRHSTNLSTNANREQSSRARSRDVKSGAIPKVMRNRHQVLPPILDRKPHITDLPDEIILEIFSYFGAQDLLVSARVCQRWLGLSNDNSLWSQVCRKYAKKTSTKISPAKQPLSYWKSLCIKSCSSARNSRSLRVLRTLDPFTGIPRDTQKSLKLAGVQWQLRILNQNGEEQFFFCRNQFPHRMSINLRWYDLKFPSFRSVKKMQVFAVNPLFFDSSGIAVPNSPYQRSLLLEYDAKEDGPISKKVFATSNDTVEGIILLPGVFVCKWKNEEEIAFVTVNLHLAQLVQRCLLGSSTSHRYVLPSHSAIHDDIDHKYGLHGYQCTLELRNQRESLWSDQFRHMEQEEGSIGTVAFSLITPRNTNDHRRLDKAPSLPWKSDLFKGIIKDLCILDMTLLDEHKKPFWCVSSPVVISDASSRSLNFEYEVDGSYLIMYQDEIGRVEMEIIKDEEGMLFIIGLTLHIALSSINSWFGTEYK